MVNWWSNANFTANISLIDPYFGNQKKALNLLSALRFKVMVRETGLEPAHRGTLDPKSSASANSATPA